MPAKVCWVNPGISYYHHARMQAFARRYGRDAIILNISDTCGFREFGFNLSNGNVAYRLETLFHGTFFRDISNRQLRDALWPRLDEIRPDVLAIQGWSDAFALLPLSWALKRRVPCVVLSESQQDDFSRSAWKESLKRRVVRLFQAGLVGGARHSEYLAHLGLPATHIFLGYDVVDNDHFRNGAEAARAAPRPTDLPANYFLTSCRFIPKKNLRLLISAYANYRSKAGANAWALIILGDGDEREALEKLRDELKLSGSVLMPGFKSYSELPTYYAWAGAFILASSIEQWGLVVNEAMASGLPVIVSERCGCAHELVRNGENGFTFAPDDSQRLSELMFNLANDKNRTAMGRQSREIIDKWSPSRFADGLGQAVEVALAAPKPHRRLSERLLVRALLSTHRLGRPKSE